MVYRVTPTLYVGEGDFPHVTLTKAATVDEAVRLIEHGVRTQVPEDWDLVEKVLAHFEPDAGQRRLRVTFAKTGSLS